MLQMSKSSKLGLLAVVGFVLAFMYIPLFVVIINSFNAAQLSSWPIQSFSLHWWEFAATYEPIRLALLNSVIVATAAMIVASILGTLVAFALNRYDFFGKSTVNLLVVLPIALPGVVTGVAFSNTYSNFLSPMGIDIGYFGLIVSHATFCIVMVFNNVFARLKRMNPSLEEASMDLGAGLFETFRLVTFPQFRSSFLAGALLAFALSFDEVYVTIFTAPPGVDTLPLWILKEMARPNQASVVNVVATVVILLSLIPVYISQRLARDDDQR
ncbi:MAG: ABC transporter permease [Microbacteriaceae bacterium]|jgi:putative spermidine/putrescine transport system permease protein|nr:ABC transporter permease [Microbacteriaceae bacterium]MBT5248197.1 ABC transporter permease [Microbacteriaceae bacterium]MBT5616698.1 ABC transporter permease [Microbacteriaceae bacterium]MBT5730161.1 ABC transporter permease [Microbacteriaceae bacterium]MDA7814609.1 ABC transporter permease [Pontimonas sp.]